MDAPPPVETWVRRASRPNAAHGRHRVAAAGDGDGGARGDGLADGLRPGANSSISNRPMGPFQ